jgi:two-component system response regulator PhoP
MRVLVLEDDPDIRASLSASLRETGYVVDEAERSSEAASLVESFEFDALVVDVRLPDGPNAGFEFVEGLRSAGVTSPVLFLTARDALRDRVAGLDAGGDDYLTKPFALEEVHARLRALLRRARPTPTNVLVVRDLRIEWNAKRVTVGDAPVHLTAKEYGILELLASNPGRVYTRFEIADHVWGADFAAETNVVDVYVKNLRRKLGAWVVETVIGSGYRFPQE